MDAGTQALIEELKAQRNVANDMLANAASKVAQLVEENLRLRSELSLLKDAARQSEG